MITLPNLNTIIDSLPFSIAYLDSEYRFSYMNKAFLNLINSSAETVLGKPCYETIGEYVNNPERKGKDKICSFCKLDEVFRNKKTVNIERPLGDKFIRVTTIPEIDDAGNIYHFIEVIEDITERKGAEKQVHDSERRLTLASSIARVGHWDWNPQTGDLIWTDEVYRIFGYEPGSITPVYELFISWIHPSDRSKVKEAVEASLRQPIPYNVEFRFYRKEGKLCIGRATGGAEFDREGKVTRLSGAMQDITEIKKTEDALRKSERKYRELYQNIRDGSVAVDMNGTISEFNEAFQKMLGYTAEEIYRLTYKDITPEKWRPIEAKILEEQVMRRGFSDIYEKEYIRKDGSTLPVELRTYLIRDENSIPIGMWAFVRDITKRKSIEEELKRLATTDTLTGALNRTKIAEIIKREIERVKRYNQPLSVILFDIDHFKEVNDRYGHNAGDYVLKTIADIVRENIRSIDYFVRWGGEEFIIFSSETQLDEAYAFAERIRKVIESRKFENVGTVTVSFGVTEFRERDTDDTFIKRADDAMYEAKKKGRNRVEVSV